MIFDGYLNQAWLEGSMKYLVIMLLLVSGVAATSVTTLYQGVPQEVYDVNGDLVTTNNCELIAEKEVLVLTQVYADTDDQVEFKFSFDLPGKPPYDYGSGVYFGQHKIFVYAVSDLGNSGVTVNGKGISGNGYWDNTSVWTNTNVGGGSRKELIKSGNNDIIIFTVPDVPVKAGDLVAEVAATSCSDAAWNRAGTPAISDTEKGCTYGVTAVQDNIFVCAQRPVDTEVPEWGMITGVLIGVLGTGFILTKR